MKTEGFLSAFLALEMRGDELRLQNGLDPAKNMSAPREKHGAATFKMFSIDPAV